MKNNSRANRESVFVIKMRYIDGKIKYPAKLHTQALGYFSTLSQAVKLIKSKPRNSIFSSNYSFKIFEIEEFVLNKWGDEGIQTRVYDRKGKFYGKYEWKIFKGRNKKDCRFQLGDIIEFIDYHSVDEIFLKTGVITELPPNKKQYEKLKKKLSKGKFIFYLDSSENRYRIFTNDGITNWDSNKNKYSIVSKSGFTGSQEMLTFSPSIQIPERQVKYLTAEFEKVKYLSH